MYMCVYIYIYIHTCYVYKCLSYMINMISQMCVQNVINHDCHYVLSTHVEWPMCSSQRALGMHHVKEHTWHVR